MLNPGPKKYMQTKFDKAFIAAVDYLVTNKRMIMKFFTQKELVEKRLGLRASSYIEIKNGNRGVPRDRVEYITRVLVNEFDVNPNFLRTGKGEILVHPLEDEQSVNNTLQEPSTNGYAQQHHQELARLKEEIRMLKDRIADKDKFIDVLMKNNAVLQKLLTDATN